MRPLPGAKGTHKKAECEVEAMNEVTALVKRIVLYSITSFLASVRQW